MAVQKIRVTVLQNGTRYDGVAYNRGDVLEIDDHLVNDWVRLGIAAVGEVALDPPAPVEDESRKAEQAKKPAKPAPKSALEELLAKTDAELAEIANEFEIVEKFPRREDLAKAIMVKAGYKP